MDVTGKLLEEGQHKADRINLSDSALDFIGKEVGDVLEPILTTRSRHFRIIKILTGII
jgi:hypothetical protein